MAREIVSTPDCLGGTWRFDGTRISVSHVAGLLARGVPLHELRADFPALTDEDFETATAWSYPRTHRFAGPAIASSELAQFRAMLDRIKQPYLVVSSTNTTFVTVRFRDLGPGADFAFDVDGNLVRIERE